jgi:hypothetical protein
MNAITAFALGVILAGAVATVGQVLRERWWRRHSDRCETMAFLIKEYRIGGATGFIRDNCSCWHCTKARAVADGAN